VKYEAPKIFVQEPTKKSRLAIKASFIFAGSYFLLFFGMSMRPNIFDESIILTGAMRVAAGQVLHQDFYANYGPGQFYTVMWLFKLFGQSILVERLYDLVLKALIVTLVYLIVSSYCRGRLAIAAAAITVVWFFGLNATTGTALIPVSLLNLLASLIILPVFVLPASTRRMLAAGAVAGLATLFRYDTGIALLVIQACVLIVAAYLEGDSFFKRLRYFVASFWACVAGFFFVTLPALLYYLARAPLHPFVHDIFIYPSKYYHRGRNLPFPGIGIKGLDNIGVYLPIAIIGISFYIAFTQTVGTVKPNETNPEDDLARRKWRGFLIAFGMLALVMYFKGIVRVSLVHMYLSILPSLLLIATMYQNKEIFSRRMQLAVTWLAWLTVSAAFLSSFREIRELHKQHASVPGAMLFSGGAPEVKATWCKLDNPLTRGFCFIPDVDHVRAIEFIAGHTVPGQKLFVGQTRHDIVFANDNLIYFATQRLPATKWSQFDPDLVNRSDIQVQMVRDLEATAPPYIVLDSELDQVREPNDSSKSSGVTLLDDYIRSKYHLIETFGEMSILQRI
jgi:Dolichyl-phosphate-mannose-protein mannosyltransferase